MLSSVLRIPSHPLLKHLRFPSYFISSSLHGKYSCKSSKQNRPCPQKFSGLNQDFEPRALRRELGALGSWKVPLAWKEVDKLSLNDGDGNINHSDETPHIL